MNKLEIDNACGQTPCLCGDIDTWHIRCYEACIGLPEGIVKEAQEKAYRIARRKLKQRAKGIVDGIFRVCK